VRSAQSSAALVVCEDCLKRRSMPVEEQFVPPSVVVAASLDGVSEEGQRVACEQTDWKLEGLSADVYAD